VICGKYNTVGSRCFLDAGHDGPHTSKWGATWTDESTARAAKKIAGEITGRD
jgi:hypothetical protein